MQTIGAFSQVQDSLSFFVQSYKEIAAWCAVVERLSGFERALERVRIQAATGGGVRRADGDATHLTVEGVDLHLPDGQPLMANVNLSLLRGDTVLLGGASGSGKSTLFRAIAGIWPFGRGEIRGPRGRPSPLSAAEAVPADRHAPGSGELSDAGGRRGRRDTARGARGRGAP